MVSYSSWPEASVGPAEFLVGLIINLKISNADFRHLEVSGDGKFPYICRPGASGELINFVHSAMLHAGIGYMLAAPATSLHKLFPLLPTHHRQLHKACLSGLMKDALRGLAIVARLGPENILNKRLRIAIIKREPG
jgi:hypothetical protein